MSTTLDSHLLDQLTDRVTGSLLAPDDAGYDAARAVHNGLVDRKLPGQLRLRESAKTPLFNGALECRLFRFDLIAGSVRQRPAADTQG